MGHRHHELICGKFSPRMHPIWADSEGCGVRETVGRGEEGEGRIRTENKGSRGSHSHKKDRKTKCPGLYLLAKPDLGGAG